MVAHGTIAFDTLTTSDQVNTGTEKSIDTSYVFNGVAKVWNNINGTGTIAIRDSFNVGSITDNGTGDYTHTYSNAMASVNQANGGFARVNSYFGFLGGVIDDTFTTTSMRHATNRHDTMNYADAVIATVTIHGDLA